MYIGDLKPYKPETQSMKAALKGARIFKPRVRALGGPVQITMAQRPALPMSLRAVEVAVLLV